MIITIVLAVAPFPIALLAGEVLFRSGQAGITLLGFVFGFRHFRPDELTRVPFYTLTLAAAVIVAITVVTVSTVIS